MPTDDVLVEKIEAVLAKFGPVALSWRHSANFGGAFSDELGFHSLSAEVCALADYVYGRGHEMAQSIKSTITCRTLSHLRTAQGLLQGTVSAIRSGLLKDLRTEILLDVQADFIEAARESAANGAKDVAAVLACIVLEDSVKRLATKSGKPELLNQEYSVVVVELFKAGAITKATKGVLLAQKDLRNSALHAQWHEVSLEAVNGLLYFLPTFIEQHGV
jgi:hypothetical protein